MKNLLPFMTGLAHQKYQKAEDGIKDAFYSGCSHWYIDGSLHTDMVINWSDERIENMRQMIEKYLCKPIFHGNFKAPLASDVTTFSTAAIAYVKQEIDLCARLNCPLIIHGGAIVEPRAVLLAKRLGLKNFLQALEELSVYADSKQVDIYLENLSNYKYYRPFHYLFTNFDEYVYIFDNISCMNNVFFFFDIGHSNVGNQDTLQVFKKFHERIKGISLSNNNGQQDQHLPIGCGDLDYKQIVTAIIECNWKGLIAFETRGIDTQSSVHQLEDIYLQVKEINEPS